MSSDQKLTNKNYNYGVNVLDTSVIPVVKEEDEIPSVIESPVDEQVAEISIHFYSKDDEEQLQQKSLIYYENTYLPNTGLLYTSDEIFLVKSAFSGKVVEIKDDSFFGKCIVIEHTNNLKTYYYGLNDLLVDVNDEISSKTDLGYSATNEIINDKKSFLFEVYYNNELINPEKFIGTNIEDYK